MPEPRRFLSPALLLLVCCLPGGVGAQSVADARARAEQLLRRYRLEERERAAADSVVQSRLRSDTIRAGALTLVVPHPMAATAQEAATVAWTMLSARYGPLASALGRHPILLEPADSARSQYSARTRLPDGSFTSQAFPASPRGLAQGLGRFGDLLLWANADSALRAWYPSSQPDAGLDSTVTAERVYLELVTSLSVSARSCLVGDDRACSEALGLRPMDDPLTGWYDAAGRRGLARRLAQLLDAPPYQMQYQECVEEGQDASCLGVLRAAIATDRLNRYAGLQQIPDPVGADPRRALVAEVVKLGGADTWSRLIASANQPLEQRLAQAARVPVDSLMRVWRRGLLAARPQPVGASPRMLFMALAWALAGLGFAMGASRWH